MDGFNGTTGDYTAVTKWGRLNGSD